MSTQRDSLTRQQLSMMIRSSLLQSTNRLHLECLPQCQNRSPQLPTVPIQQLPQCNRLQINCSYCVASVVRIGRLCSYYVIKRICTIFYEFKNSKIRDFYELYTQKSRITNLCNQPHTPSCPRPTAVICCLLPSACLDRDSVVDSMTQTRTEHEPLTRSSES